MIRRVTDAATVDRWVRRDFPDAGSLGEALSNEMNVCLAYGEGGAIFVWRGPGVYEVHCFFEAKGKEVRDASLEILDIMRRDYGARLIWAAIPDDSRKVKIYVRWLGFKPVGGAVFPHGPCEIFTLGSVECLQ